MLLSLLMLMLLLLIVILLLLLCPVPAGSPSLGGDVVIYVKDINHPSLPTPLYSVLVSISIFADLSTVFHSIHSSDNSPFPHSVLPVLSLVLPALLVLSTIIMSRYESLLQR